MRLKSTIALIERRSRRSGKWWTPGLGEDFWTGLTGFSGFTGLEHNPQRIYEMDSLGFNPVNPLNPVDPVKCICVSSG